MENDRAEGLFGVRAETSLNSALAELRDIQEERERQAEDDEVRRAEEARRRHEEELEDAELKRRIAEEVAEELRREERLRLEEAAVRARVETEVRVAAERAAKAAPPVVVAPEPVVQVRYARTPWIVAALATVVAIVLAITAQRAEGSARSLARDRVSETAALEAELTRLRATLASGKTGASTRQLVPFVLPMAVTRSSGKPRKQRPPRPARATREAAPEAAEAPTEVPATSECQDSTNPLCGL